MKLITITPEPSTADLFFVFVSFIVPSLCFWVTEVTQLEVCVLLDLPLRSNICDTIYGPTNKAELPMKIFLCQNEREELRVSTLSRFAPAEVRYLKNTHLWLLESALSIGVFDIPFVHHEEIVNASEFVSRSKIAPPPTPSPVTRSTVGALPLVPVNNSGVSQAVSVLSLH